jgi:hypothetical protein
LSVLENSPCELKMYWMLGLALPWKAQIYINPNQDQSVGAHVK